MQDLIRFLAEFVPAEVAFNNMALQMHGKNSCSDLQEDLIDRIQFCNEIIRGLTTFLRHLRDYLVLKGFEYQLYPNQIKTMYVLVYYFFSSEENCELAMQQLILLHFTMKSRYPVLKLKILL